MIECMGTWGKFGANRIAEVRQRREPKLSQQGLADAVGCSVGQIRKLEHGDRKLDQVWMQRLAKPLGCEPQDLMAVVNPSSTTVAEDMGNGGRHAQIQINQIELRGPISIDGTARGPLEDHRVASVQAVFGFPANGFRDVYGADPSSVKIIEIRGDEAAPEMAPGQRVLIDTSDVIPSPPGIFIVWDGLGLVVRRIQFLAHSEPPTVRIAPINPLYLPYDRSLDLSFIQGRIVGLWRRY